LPCGVDQALRRSLTRIPLQVVFTRTFSPPFVSIRGRIRCLPHYRSLAGQCSFWGQQIQVLPMPPAPACAGSSKISGRESPIRSIPENHHPKKSFGVREGHSVHPPVESMIVNRSEKAHSHRPEVRSALLMIPPRHAENAPANPRPPFPGKMRIRPRARCPWRSASTGADAPAVLQQ
jgi:hypothetical protein